jgi:plasmid stabilization system protein ParE
MTFTVLWSSDAERRLAQIWLDATNRDAVAHAADEIDSKLRRDPERVGESRHQSDRLVVVFPLAVYFHVSTEDRIVRVLTVRRARQKS